MKKLVFMFVAVAGLRLLIQIQSQLLTALTLLLLIP